MLSLHLLFTSIVICTTLNCVKSVQIRSFFWSVCSRIWIEYAKIRTRKNSVFEHFPCSAIYTHLFILIYTYLSKFMFSLYYYTNLIKLIKYGKIEITTKFSRLKSVSRIDDDYLETATGGVL